MKLLHLGDLHIGKSVNDYSMIEDQRYILDQILDIGAKREVDGILIAGDVFDKSVPSEEAVRVFDRFLCQLAEREGVEMPICRCAYEVLDRGKRARDVVSELMGRTGKDELLGTTWL